MKPSIQFAKRKDGVKIAYSQFGKGQPLVFSPAWVTSLRHILENLVRNILRHIHGLPKIGHILRLQPHFGFRPIRFFRRFVQWMRLMFYLYLDATPKGLASNKRLFGIVRSAQGQNCRRPPERKPVFSFVYSLLTPQSRCLYNRSARNRCLTWGRRIASIIC